MSQITKVAVLQCNANDDVDRNLRSFEALLRRAVDAGAQLVVAPECFAFLGPDGAQREIAETVPGDGPIFSRCVALAKELNVELILGGFWERGSTAQHSKNACLMIDGQGALRAVYRKMHLFDVDLPDGTKLCESASVEPGQAPVVVDTCAGKVGLSICYDLRFPELYRALVDRGATILTVPAAFTETTGKAHWRVLLRARAIEQQCYVLAAAQVGRHLYRDGSGKRESHGHAMIIDPWGVVLAECGAGEGYAIAEIDLAYLAQVRQGLPALQHRRADL